MYKKKEKESQKIDDIARAEMKRAEEEMIAILDADMFG